MEQWTDRLRDVVLVEFVALSLVVVWHWARHRIRGVGWAALTFSLIAAVAGLGRLVPTLSSFLSLEWVLKGLVAVLLVVPFCLYRFAASFERPYPWVRRTAVILTLLAVAATFALPYFPLPGTPKPWWFAAYRTGIAVQWSFLFMFVAKRLWQGGKGHARPIRNRMRLLAAATAGMNLQIILGVTGLTERPAVALANQMTTVVMAIVFMLGLAPPSVLRYRWLRRDGDLFQAAIADLVGLTSARDVADRLLPHVAALVGGSRVKLLDADGRIVAQYDNVPSPSGEPAPTEVGPEDESSEAIQVPIRFGTGGRLVVWTSVYTPFFGHDELRTLTWLSDLLGLVMERCVLAEREHQFIANAAHEFRTPLTVLSGLASTLSTSRHTLSEQQLADCLDAMARNGERAQTLANNLLDLAQIERGTLGVEISSVGVADVVQSALGAVPKPDGKHVAVDLEDAVLLTDPHRLEQVLVNLVSNAYRYGGEQIAIGSAVDGDALLLWVADDGDGVPGDLASRIFEPFARGAHGNGQGVGLGLAITQRLVEALDGRIEYEHSEPRGARFTIRLPTRTGSRGHPVAAGGR